MVRIDPLKSTLYMQLQSNCMKFLKCVSTLELA